MKSIKATVTENELLTRIIAPRQALPNCDIAQTILDWQWTDRDLRTMKRLAAKSRSGTLSDEDQQTIETYSRITNLIDLMKSKARLTLKRNAAKSGGRHQG